MFKFKFSFALVAITCLALTGLDPLPGRNVDAAEGASVYGSFCNSLEKTKVYYCSTVCGTSYSQSLGVGDDVEPATQMCDTVASCTSLFGAGAVCGE